MAAVVFDLDGTLVDTKELHARSFVEALRERGKRVDLDAVRGLIGLSGVEIVRRLCPDVDPVEVYERKVEIFLENLDLVREVDGATEVLDALGERGVRIGLATSSNRRMARALVGRFGWKFDYEVTADDVSRGKPEPDMLAICIEALGGPAVYVGDTEFDAQMAEWCGSDALILGKNIRSLRDVLGYRFGSVRVQPDPFVFGTPVRVDGTATALLIAREGSLPEATAFGLASHAVLLSSGSRIKSSRVRFTGTFSPGDVLVARATPGSVKVRVRDRVILEADVEVVP